MAPYFWYAGDKDFFSIDERDVLDIGETIVVNGQLTTPITMHTILGLLVNYQDVQEKAYSEIQEVIGDRTPSCQDKCILPYIEALIFESMRYGTIFPYGFPRCTSEDTELKGYLIPQGTMIVANIWSISHDVR